MLPAVVSEVHSGGVLGQVNQKHKATRVCALFETHKCSINIKQWTIWKQYCEIVLPMSPAVASLLFLVFLQHMSDISLSGASESPVIHRNRGTFQVQWEGARTGQRTSCCCSKDLCRCNRCSRCSRCSRRTCPILSLLFVVRPANELWGHERRFPGILHWRQAGSSYVPFCWDVY